jgi:outer membrane protein assembly factor BamB
MASLNEAERLAGVVAVGHAGSVLLIEAATGRVLWERQLADVPGGSACAGEPVSVRLVNAAVIAGAMGHVFALALEDGSVLWHVARRGRGAGATSLAVRRD